MNISITITSNYREIVAALGKLAEKQVPFASAVALTRTALDARDAVRQALPQHFTLRRTNFISNGVVGISANKRDWPHQSSQVAVRDEFMARQELGGEKRGRSGRKVAIPQGARPTPQTITTPSKWPSALLNKSGSRPYFIAQIKKGRSAGKTAILRRDSKDRYPLQVLYLLQPEVKVPARWHMRETVEKTVQTVYEARFLAALDEAIKTAR